MTTKRTKQQQAQPPLGNIIVRGARSRFPVISIRQIASIPGAITKRVKIIRRSKRGTIHTESGYCWYPNAREGEQP